MFIFTASLALLATTTTTLCSAAPTTRTTTPLIRSSLAKREASGPKMNGTNFPDPSIINVNDTWYSFSTNSGGRNIQIATSDDFDTWTLLQTDALPDLPAWISDQPTDVWAPDVSLLDNGYFIMYYTARTDEDSRYHCVGAATSQSIEGPFEPCSDDPLICDLSVGGAIDPAGYEEDGQRYILWKVDGNALPYGSGPCGPTNHTTPLYIQPVAADGVTLQDSKSQLVDNQGSSDDGIVEAPSLTKCGSTYVLFFSSGCFTTTNYKVNYATSTSLTGGFQRAQNALFQTGTQNLTAPGGASIDRDAKHLVFHANYNGGRALWTDIVTIDGDQVSA